jgi:hypothetical protein
LTTWARARRPVRRRIAKTLIPAVAKKSRRQESILAGMSAELTNFVLGLYSTSPGSAEGVFARRFDDGARRGARGRGATYPTRSGGAGAPPGDTTIPCEELADGWPLRLARGLSWPLAPARGHAREPRQGETAGQKARPGAVTTLRWSAERRPRSRKRARQTKEGSAARRSIPSALPRGKRSARRKPGGTTAYPAPQRIRAMTHACLKFGCLKI